MPQPSDSHTETMRAIGRALAKRGDLEDQTDVDVLRVVLDGLNLLWARWPQDRQEWHDLDDTLELIDYLPNNTDSEGALAELDEDGDFVDRVE